MDKYEKIIKGLEIHQTPITNGCPPDCPYYSTDFCLETLFGDSLALIKEQKEELDRLKKEGA